MQTKNDDGRLITGTDNITADITIKTMDMLRLSNL
jgi:hypothetical protein